MGERCEPMAEVLEPHTQPAKDVVTQAIELLEAYSREERTR